jgi:hypothetical protein
MDPFEQPVEALLLTLEKLDIDWTIGVPKKAVAFGEDETRKVSEDGNVVTQWSYSGSLWEDDHVFSSEEEVLGYDPFGDNEGKVRVCSKKYRDNALNEAVEDYRLTGNTTLATGIYYTTLFQFFIMAFGWEMFLTTAATEPERFQHTIELFTRFSLENTKKWAKSEIPVFFFHDDIAITRGLVFPPSWYRKNIFPSYERILDPVRKSGKKIIFVSDGNYQEVIDDIFALGVDGVMVQNEIDMSDIMKKYGRDKVVIGNISTRIITEGNKEDIRREVQRCVDIGKDSPGYFIKASGELPHNIPVENMDWYFEYCRSLGRRGA